MKYFVFVFLFTIPLLSYSQCDTDNSIDLSGMWTGYGYNCTGPVLNEKISITHDLNTGQVVATKITGDACVTAGTVTFQGVFDGTARSFDIISTTGNPANPNSGTAPAVVIINSADEFNAFGVRFARFTGSLNAVDLSGNWTGFGFNCPDESNELAEKLNITHDLITGEVIATKVTGDDCVTAGTITFQGTFDAMTAEFNVSFTTGTIGAPNSNISASTIVLISHNEMFQIGGDLITFIRDNSSAEDAPITLLEDLESDCFDATQNTLHNDYACQYYCIAQKTSTEYYTNGVDGWAYGFASYIWQAFESRNDGPLFHPNNCTGDILLPGVLDEYLCFASEGILDHYFTEMLPTFFSFCGACPELSQDADLWDENHDLFLENAVVPCFTEFIDMPDFLGCVSARNTEFLARLLRDVAQEFCTNSASSNQGIKDIMTTFTNDFLGGNTCCVAAGISDALGNEFYAECTDFDIIDVGELVLDEIIDWINPFNRRSGNPTDTIYFIDLDTSYYEINNGSLMITSSPSPLAGISPVVNVFSYTQDSVITLLAQFIINDNDEDGDLIGDQFETDLGLNPNISNFNSTDIDNDGLNDFIESMIGSNPLNEDSDGDGFNDNIEFNTNNDFNNPNNFPREHIFVSETIGNNYIEVYDFSTDYNQYIIKGDLTNSWVILSDTNNVAIDTLDNQNDVLLIKMADYSSSNIKLTIQNQNNPDLFFESIILN